MNTLTSTSNGGSSSISSNKLYISKVNGNNYKTTTITQGNEEVPLMYKYFKRRLEREERKKRESKEGEDEEAVVVDNKEDVNDNKDNE
jgi:hypothetical protein